MTDEASSGHETYPVHGKPWGVGPGERKWLSVRPDEDLHEVRRGLDYQIVPDSERGEATVEITLHHQRRGKTPGTWDEEPFLLYKLKAGEAIRLPMNSDETLALYRHLESLYRVGAEGVPRGDREFAVVEGTAIVATGEAASMLRAFLERHGADGFLAAVSELEGGPGLVQVIALQQDYERKAAALAEFEQHMKPSDPWREPVWQEFFERNDWIFGHGLDYHFLVTGLAQPNFGGADVTGTGGEKGDFLMATAGDVRFSVLVEIKRPDSELMGPRLYRNGAHEIGAELAGGVAQLQANCDRWAKVARREENRAWEDETGITTVAPKGILVIGNTRQLDTRAKQDTFHRFRRNLWNPEILTYDELLSRARFLVRRADPDAPAEPEPDDNDDQPPEAYDHEAREPGEPPDWEPDPDDYDRGFTPFGR